MKRRERLSRVNAGTIEVEKFIKSPNFSEVRETSRRISEVMSGNSKHVDNTRPNSFYLIKRI